MLALYTQSVDSALLLAAVKEKYYAGEDADLFYISAATDEVGIIRQLKKAGIFCNIYIIRIVANQFDMLLAFFHLSIFGYGNTPNSFQYVFVKCAF